MYSENTILALLQSSVTGAGLVLAIYALITTVAHRLFEERKSKINSIIPQIKTQAKGLEVQSDRAEFDKLSSLVKNVQDRKQFPKYISIGMLSSFLGFLVVTILCLIWLSDFYQSFFGLAIVLVFVITILVFSATGIFTVKDVYYSLKTEYSLVQKELKDVETSSSSNSNTS